MARGAMALIPPERASRGSLESPCAAPFTAASSVKEGGGLSPQPFVLFLKDRAAKQFIDPLAGRPLAFGAGDVVIHRWLDREALGNHPHISPHIIYRIHNHINRRRGLSSREGEGPLSSISVER